MIQVVRQPKPDILIEKEEEWTQNVIRLVNVYGTYGDIPDSIKDRIEEKYRHNQIKRQLKRTSHKKCVYCEARVRDTRSNNQPERFKLTVEHFYPKSIYPDQIFKWENLFLACGSCNSCKGNHDPDVVPIVNPETENPEEYFIYEELLIKESPEAPNVQKARDTIIACRLDRDELIFPLGDIAKDFREKNTPTLSAIVNDCKDLENTNRKKVLLRELYNALEDLRELSSEKNHHTGFIRSMLRNSQIVVDAVNLILVNNADVDISEQFTEFANLLRS